MQRPNKQCPWCQAGDQASTVSHIAGQPAKKPSPGDPCLCTECGQWSVWADGDRLEKPDEVMAQRIKDSAEALKLKLTLLLWNLAHKKKRPGLSKQALLDIRNKAVDEAREKIFASVQLCERASEAAEIYMAVMLDQVISLSVLMGCITPGLDGEDCIERALHTLATACADLDIAEHIDERVAEHRNAKREEEE